MAKKGDFLSFLKNQVIGSILSEFFEKCAGRTKERKRYFFVMAQNILVASAV